MHQLHLIHSMRAEGGGPAEVIRQLRPRMEQLGHRMDVVTCDPSDDGDPGFPPGSLKAFAGWPKQHGYSRAMLEWLKVHGGDYDAIIVHGLWQFPGWAARTAAQATGTPYFVFPHGMLAPWFRRRYPLKHLKKAIYWKWMESKVIGDANAVIFTAEGERNDARNSFSPYRCREVVAPIGTQGPPDELEECKRAFLEFRPELKGRKWILFLGRLHEKKGCDILIRAFGKLLEQQPEATREYDLVFAGSAASEEMERSLRLLAERHCPAGRVHWLGMVRDKVKWGAFLGGDVFVLCSHQENFGIAVAESLACGLPVLISKEVNIWNEIASDGAGWADADSEAACLRLLIRWVAIGDEEKGAMRKNARACFLQRYEAKRAADSFVEALYANGVPRMAKPHSSSRK